jgi:16S rRNA A1518/A1519 N6-dimethyltransferase RsmA/KsgA/DIM1 with predicted DNA glycosylase/AP lyase activity
MPESRFDAWVAERYDALWPELFDPTVVEQTVEFLALWAGAGPALEFGIGTGRIALPLSRRGIRVHGIELSPAMAGQLQARQAQPQPHIGLGES